LSHDRAFQTPRYAADSDLPGTGGRHSSMLAAAEAAIHRAGTPIPGYG